MDWFSKIFSVGASSLVDSIGKAVDSVTTSDEEKLILRNELSKAMNEFKERMEDKILLKERELTIRHSNDMASDSWLSKNIRPILLIYLVFIISVLSMGDSISYFNFDVKDSYIELFEVLLITSFSFYFGSRGLEKVTKIKTINGKSGTN